MSFTIRLQSANFKKLRKLETEPVTGWSLPSFRDLGLSDVERRAAMALFSRKGAWRPGVDDRVHLVAPDGTRLEACFPGLYTGGECREGYVSAPAIVRPLLQLAVELATEIRLILWPDGFPRPLVISEELRRELVVPLPMVQSVFSAPMLWNLLVPRSTEPPAEEVRVPAPPTE
ncbi:MAG: hypothetical protein KF873_16285 [Gemmataceae bacterium]|nr:hypothetical protein [Gemmataceae bacterium]